MEFPENIGSRISKTPESHPDDPIVGHFFESWTGGLFYCRAFEEDLGYWMVDCLSIGAEIEPEDFNVSSYSINTHFYEVN